MSNFFSERGYPDNILSKALNRVQNVNRESALEPSTSNNEERIPFTLTFHPNNLAARNVVLRNFKILQSDSETASIFPNPPLVSFKRAPWKQIVVCRSLYSYKTSKIIEVRNIQNWRRYPPKYRLPWQQVTEDSVESYLERLPIKL